MIEKYADCKEKFTPLRPCTEEDFEEYDSIEFYRNAARKNESDLLLCYNFESAPVNAETDLNEKITLMECSGENCETDEMKKNMFRQLFMAKMYMIIREFDSSKYDAWPTVTVVRQIGYVKFNLNMSQTILFIFRRNEIDTLDDLLQFKEPTHWPEPFFDLEDVIKDSLDPFFDPFGERNYVYIEFQMSRSFLTHSRTSYALLDLFGDFGGVLEVGTISLGLFCHTWAEFQFILKALQKVYNVKTRNESVFRNSSAVKYSRKRKKFRSRLTDESEKSA